jgi:hypothetical protein
MRSYAATRLGLLVLFLFGTTAHATAIQWNLVDIVFDDGATASGSFIYDADVNQYWGINITTTTGRMPARNYRFSTSYPSAGLAVFYSGDSPMPADDGTLYLDFPVPLTNTMRVIPLTGGNAVSQEATCSGQSGTCTPGNPYRTVVAGAVSSVVPVPPAVPLPPAVYLFGSALGLMGMMRRKLSSACRSASTNEQ